MRGEDARRDACAEVGVALRRNGVIGAVRKDPRRRRRAAGLAALGGQTTDLFGGDGRRMWVVLDEAVRPDRLVAALDDCVHSCRMPLVVEGEPDLERAVRKHLAAAVTGRSVCAVVSMDLEMVELRSH